jgi:hypothetical protein
MKRVPTPRIASPSGVKSKDVVHEGGQNTAHQHEHHDQADLAAAHDGVNASADDVGDTRFEQRGTDDEDRQHGDDRGRREPGESLARCEVAAEDENDQTEEGRQVDRQLLGQEEIDHRRQEGEEKGDLRRHQGHCSRSGRISQHA